MQIGLSELGTLGACDSGLRMRLFGTFAIDPAEFLPNSRKARALLAWLYLQVEPVDRARAAGMLWSMRGHDQAHASLRQCLFELKNLVRGDPPLLFASRDMLILDRAKIDTDIAEIVSLAEAHDAKALAQLLPSGPVQLLSDLNDIDPAFDEWLQVERAHWHEHFIQVALDCVEGAISSGDMEGARALSARISEVDPANEAAARVEMRSAAAMGDRDSVRRIFQRIESTVANEFEADLMPETRQVFRQLMDAPASIQNGARSDSTKIALKQAGGFVWTRKKAGIVAGGLGGALALIAATLYVGGTERKETRINIETASASSSNKETAQFADSLAAHIADLAGTAGQDIVVVDNPGWLDNVRSDLIVQASTKRDKGLLSAQASLIHASSGTVLWSNEVGERPNPAAPLSERTAVQIARLLRCGLNALGGELSDIDSISLQLVFASCQALDDESIDGAHALAKKAAGRLPDNPSVWAWLALLGGYKLNFRGDEGGDRKALRSEVEGQVSKAVAMNSRSARSYTARGLIVDEGGLRYVKMRPILEQGLAAHPDDPELLGLYSQSLLSAGDLDRSLIMSEQSLNLDPLSPYKHTTQVRRLVIVGEIDEAFKVLERAERIWPDHPDVRMHRMRLMAEYGDPTAALALLEGYKNASGRQPTVLPLAYPILIWRRDGGNPDIALMEREAEAEFIKWPPGAYYIAAAFARAGQIERAYAWLARAPVKEVSNQWVVLFRHDLAPLRRDPRFMRVMQRLGLNDYWKKTGLWPDFCSEPGLGYDCAKEAERLSNAAAMGKS